jgi:hypothetical protein
MSTHIIPDEAARTEYRGMYEEAVSKIADSVEDGIRAGEIKCQDEALRRIDAAVWQNDWVTDSNGWAVHTLLWSKHACKAFVAGLVPIGLTREGMHLVHNPHDLPMVREDNLFPFSCFAHSAMFADVCDEVSTMKEWAKLPLREPQARETGRWSSAKPPETNISKARSDDSQPAQ